MVTESGNKTTISGHYRGIELRFVISSRVGEPFAVAEPEIPREPGRPVGVSSLSGTERPGGSIAARSVMVGGGPV
jgi:hypothetical protein